MQTNAQRKDDAIEAALGASGTRATRTAKPEHIQPLFKAALALHWYFAHFAQIGYVTQMARYFENDVVFGSTISICIIKRKLGICPFLRVISRC